MCHLDFAASFIYLLQEPWNELYKITEQNMSQNYHAFC